MAWETGTATGVNDLLSKLSTFLAAAGWTINKDAVSGSGRWLSVQKGADLFVNLVSDPASTGTTNPGPWIYVVGATGYSGAGAYTAEPGAQPVATFANKMIGSFTSYYFFEGDDYCHVVVEIEAGRFRHIQFGTLQKACTFTGGTYVMGTAPLYNANTPSNPDNMANNYPWSSISSTTTRGNYIRADAGDGVQWHSNYQSDTYRHAGMWREINSGSGSEPYRVGYVRRMLEATPSTVNGLPVLIAPRALVKKANNLYAILGTPKDLRLVAMDNNQPKDVLTIGADEWYLFPWTLRSATVNDAATDKSAYYGIALRKNTA
jgi:hypothetical protein